jgi:mRNA interferase MazF
VSVSLPDDDVDFLDRYADEHGERSRRRPCSERSGCCAQASCKAPIKARGPSGATALTPTTGTRWRATDSTPRERGEILLAELDPVRGSETNKRRPVVVVSNDGANEAATRGRRGVVTVVPVTSSVARVHPFQVLLPADATGLSRDSKARAEQIRAIAYERLGARVGVVPVMARLDDAIRLHLGL